MSIQNSDSRTISPIYNLCFQISKYQDFLLFPKFQYRFQLPKAMFRPTQQHPDDIHTLVDKCLGSFNRLIDDIKKHGNPQGPSGNENLQSKRDQLRKWAADFRADLHCSSKQSLDYKFKQHESPRGKTISELKKLLEDLNSCNG